MTTAYKVIKHRKLNTEKNITEISETYVRAEPKIGVNDKCPCGSGLKYKKCCLNK